MGIGLFTAKSTIEDKMGGKISVKNTKEGARFTLAIPAINNLPDGHSRKIECLILE